MKRKIFVDMDGVLADFDRHHETVFGVRSCKVADNVDWKKVRAVKDFYLNIPPMEDVEELWAFLRPMQPTVLTGVPSSLREEASMNKREWVRKYFGPNVPVICCPAKDKHLFGEPGSILIDDWEKYAHNWVNMGGIFITHTSAAKSIEAVKAWLT